MDTKKRKSTFHENWEENIFKTKASHQEKLLSKEI